MTMTDDVVTDSSEIDELTVDKLDEAGGGMDPGGGRGVFPPGPTVVDLSVFHFAGLIIHD